MQKVDTYSLLLLDETALLSCMAYVDLNPVWVVIVDDLVASNFSSFQVCIQQVQVEAKLVQTPEHPAQIFAVLPFNLKDYIYPIDWIGRFVRDDKRVAIASHQSWVLAVLDFSHECWLVLSLEI